MPFLYGIEKLIKRKLDQVDVPDFKPRQNAPGLTTATKNGQLAPRPFFSKR